MQLCRLSSNERKNHKGIRDVVGGFRTEGVKTGAVIKGISEGTAPGLSLVLAH